MTFSRDDENYSLTAPGGRRKSVLLGTLTGPVARHYDNAALA
jgi:hypothetical protein